jgi:putative spermidine/putrescine transport system ATP-binding protein
VPPHRRDIGMVFQNYALFPHMTVAENIAFPLTVRKPAAGGDRDRRRPRARPGPSWAAWPTAPAQLSGGQQQRVALARALVFDPPLVLMDEPLGALDKQLREQMQIEIKHLHRRLGVTWSTSRTTRARR